MALIPEFGHYALVVALMLAIGQTVLPILGWWRCDARLMSAGSSTALGQWIFVLISYCALTTAFIGNDFSVAYVAHNSNTGLPLAYRIAAVWGAHEGSLLLWALILATWSLAVVLFSRALPREIKSLVLAVMGFIAVGFYLFMLLTSNPFERLFPVPADGRDLNPLLQDPGLVVHPPMLYMGYVGLSVAFAFAIAALISGQMDAAWSRWSRPWTTGAWLFLTLGIMLGSWWAYNELGWGGWWFWDPVENASFMPWLVATALIHSLAATEKRGVFRRWTLLLAILAFSLSLLGTFLVRSGVLVSVHAFASDPDRGTFILAFLGVVVAGSLLLYAIRAPVLASYSPPVRLVSREGLLLLNNVFLTVSAAMVLFGTLYPIGAQAFGYKVSVGPPYFNAMFVLLAGPLLLILPFAAVSRWKRDRFTAWFKGIRWVLLIAIPLGLIWPHIFKDLRSAGLSMGVLLALILALVVLLASLADVLRWLRLKGRIPRGQLGMNLAHAGIGVTVLGIALVTGAAVQLEKPMKPGDMLRLGDHVITLESVERRPGPNYEATVAKLVLDGETVIESEKRYYPVRGEVMTDAGIHARLDRDFYISLGENLGENSGENLGKNPGIKESQSAWGFRLYLRPFVRCIWLGAILMALGGLLAISDRRYRLRTLQETVS